MSLRRLQRNNFPSSKTSCEVSSRHLQDVFKTYLQDVFKLKTKNCYAEDQQMSVGNSSSQIFRFLGDLLGIVGILKSDGLDLDSL